MNKKKIGGVIGGVLALVLAVLGGSQLDLGSVQQGSGYHSTSTHSGTQFEVLLTTSTVVNSSFQGELGSLVITGADTSRISIYDATTTIASKRAAADVTSTILLADFAPSAAVGTYTFDTIFQNGLLVVYNNTSNIPSSTLTWR